MNILKQICLVFLALFLMTPILISAQDKEIINVKGRILEENSKQPVEFVNITILNPSDSSLITGAKTTNNGNFSINVAEKNNFIVKISYLGYLDSYKNISGKKSIDLGNINIKENTFMLDAAVVKARANEIVVSGDTIEYNADSYKVQENAALEELLKKMPGVEVDTDGKITVNGKEIKKIMVDGKEFFSDDPKIASKNLPAKMVEKLQVLDKKSDMAMLTGFDDGEEETVINLQVKPGMKQGVFGNGFAGGGNKDKYEGNAFVAATRNNTSVTLLGGANNTNNAGASDLAGSMFGGGRGGMNFGGNNGVNKVINTGLNIATEVKDKLKLSSDFRYMNTDSKVISNSETSYTSNDNPGSASNNSTGNSKANSFAANMRMEWTPDKMTKIIFRPRVEFNDNKRIQNIDSETLYDENTPMSSKNNNTTKIYNSKGNGNKLTGDLDVSRKLNENGRTITLGVNGSSNNSDNKGTSWSEIKYLTLAKDSVIDQKFDEDTKNYSWSIRASYVEPIKKNLFAELSYRITGKEQETDKKTFVNANKDDQTLSPNFNIIDTTDTRYVKNNFINQNISLKVRGMAAQYNWMLGVAMEPSSSKTTIAMLDNPDLKIPNRNFLHFSPIAQFNYLPSKTTNLRVDYNANTSEPSSLQLFDGVYSRDGLNTTSGNPNLKPSFTSNLNIRYRSSNPQKGSFVGLFGGFNHVSNAIVATRLDNPQTGGKDTNYTNVNGNMGGNMRFIINTPFRNRNWSVNSMSFIRYNINNTLIDQNKNKAKTLVLQQNMGVQFKSDIFDCMLRGNITYNNIRNSLSKNNNTSTYNYGGSYNFNFYAGDWLMNAVDAKIWKGFNFQSDLNYSTNSGYGAGFKQDEWLWNASVSKDLFSSSRGTGSVRFKIYDLLKQKSNISRTYSADQIVDSMTNTIGSYFMVHFVYKFQIFGKGMKMEDMSDSDRGPGGGRGSGGSGHGGPGRGPM